MIDRYDPRDWTIMPDEWLVKSANWWRNFAIALSIGSGAYASVGSLLLVHSRVFGVVYLLGSVALGFFAYDSLRLSSCRRRALGLKRQSDKHE